MINIPFETPWIGENTWITVPPQGYGGIQWIVSHINDGLLELGNEIYLLGAPGSVSHHPSLHALEIGRITEITEWLLSYQMDVIHDHSNQVPLNTLPESHRYVSTHHLTGRPLNRVNAIYSSYAQRNAGGSIDAPVVRIPVNSKRYIFCEDKDEYLLMLGRVSRWKGVLEAAQFARASGRRLVVAGPAWERDYFAEIMAQFGDIIDYRGEVGGEERLMLLANAKALIVLSQPVVGPWGDTWCEPGATVVSEAAASGTPVISSDNGCLAEITPHVGCVIPQSARVTSEQASHIMDSLPAPTAVRDAALREWNYVKIAQQYEDLYGQVINGRTWV